ncbi:hypothetical protein [Haloarcula litorea]|uniref:hypothetical protein n=1 Tax=Haloarcula litorea TaxID=3032579 RepID=UPI0023E8B929|nr:hypothetical protein [Halomicroarcula sp. GDY20]
MPSGRPAVELRSSVAALATEWWVLVGGLGAYLLYSAWVLATGAAVGALAPGFADASLPAVGGVTGLTAVAAVLWIGVPAVAVARLLPRPLVNDSRNVDYPYRDIRPGPLLVPPGLVSVAALAATVVRGPAPWLTGAALVAGVFLLVRTAAYDKRVYRPVPLLSPVCLAAAGAALAGGWLVHAPMVAGVADPLAAPVSAAGVPTVAAAVVTATGGVPGRSLAALAAVPTVAATAYVCCQVAASLPVWWRAPYPEGTFTGGTGGRRLPPTDGEPSVSRRSVTSDARSADGPGARGAPEDRAPVDDVPDEFAADTEVFRRSETGAVDRDGPERIATVRGPEPDRQPTFSAPAGGPADGAATGDCPACGLALSSSDAVAYCPECGEPLD